MWHTSWIELSKSALSRNIKFLQQLIGSEVKFSSVIKGNAYGHGINVFVPLAEACGIHHFSTFSAAEALSALNNRTAEETKIMIMGIINEEEIGWAIENGVSFYIFDLDRLRAALDIAGKLKIPAHIHLELETGLRRTGLETEELEQVIDMLCQNRDKFVVEGVCTHYAGAESVANYLRIHNQITSFENYCQYLKKRKINPIMRHTACSAAAMMYPETSMDMVRFGIAHYGFWPSKETKMHYLVQQNVSQNKVRDPLLRVMSWKSNIMSFKSVKPGDFVGYGMSYQATREQKLATVPVGYYHGFTRNLSNLGFVLVHGKRRPVVGVVNMNMMMIDVTDAPEVKKGDEVVIIGRQKKMNISVTSFSDLSNFLNYEALVRLPAEIPKIIVD